LYSTSALTTLSTWSVLQLLLLRTLLGSRLQTRVDGQFLLSKSPVPSQLLRALGAVVDIRPLPLASALITTCENQLLAIKASLVDVVGNKRLGPSESASVAGKLQFTTSSFSRKCGKAMIRCVYEGAHKVAGIISTHRFDRPATGEFVG